MESSLDKLAQQIDNFETMAQEDSKSNEANSETANIQNQLAEEVRLRKFTEAILESRQQELESHEAENLHLSQQLDGLTRDLVDTQRQLSEARALDKINSKQLQDAKEHMFHLRPSRKDITESEAQQAYKNLCDGVQRWVENRLRAILADLGHGQLRGRPVPASASRFCGLIRESARNWMDADESDDFHVMAVIMQYLWLVFFAKSFYCPLDDDGSDATVKWIDELENAMSKQRDISHCREWRSETLSAITSQPGFASRRTKYVHRVAADLASILSNLVPRLTPMDLQSSVLKSIVEPAANLAHDLHLASNIYSVKWPARTAWSRLELYECLNLANGGMLLDLGGTTHKSPSRRNVSYLFDVAPGLFVEHVKGSNKSSLKVICRPTVLVNSDDGEIEQKPTVVRWLWKYSSGPSGPQRASIHKSKPLMPGRLSKI